MDPFTFTQKVNNISKITKAELEDYPPKPLLRQPSRRASFAVRKSGTKLSQVQWSIPFSFNLNAPTNSRTLKVYLPKSWEVLKYQIPALVQINVQFELKIMKINAAFLVHREPAEVWGLAESSQQKMALTYKQMSKK
jgi:hypothetical protein